jgi:hypothetical protein
MVEVRLSRTLVHWLTNQSVVLKLLVCHLKTLIKRGNNRELKKINREEMRVEATPLIMRGLSLT